MKMRRCQWVTTVTHHAHHVSHPYGHFYIRKIALQNGPQNSNTSLAIFFLKKKIQLPDKKFAVVTLSSATATRTP